MICREIMNAFRPKQRQSMWLKYIFYVVSVCRRCTFYFNMTKTQRNQRKICFFLSICHVTCIPNFQISKKEASILSFVDMPIFVKRSKGIKIICRGMPEVFNVTVLLSVLGNWEILKFDRICMQCFFITGSLRVLQRHYMYIVYWHRLFIKRILFYVPKRCWWESYTAKF